MHTCSSSPPSLISIYSREVLEFPEDDRYVDKEFAKDYTMVSVIGSGAYGVVLEVIHKGRVYAMKYFLYEYDDSGHEIDISCKISELRPYTPVFGEILGWTLSMNTPQDWIDKLGNDNLENEQGYPYLYMCMERFTHNIKNIRPSEHTLRCFFFIYLHAFAMARKHLGHFRHRDIHFGNLMITLRDNNKPLVLPVNEEYSYEILNLPMEPKLIDFGMAKTKANVFEEEEEKYPFKDADKKEHPPRNDFKRLVMTFSMLYHRLNLSLNKFTKFVDGKTFGQLFHHETASDNYEVILKVLKHRFFDIPEIQTARTNVESAQKRHKEVNTKLHREEPKLNKLL